MIRIFACGFTEKTGLGLYGRKFLQMVQAVTSPMRFSLL
jgi:hypothetical protein